MPDHTRLVVSQSKTGKIGADVDCLIPLWYGMVGSPGYRKIKRSSRRSATGSTDKTEVEAVTKKERSLDCTKPIDYAAL